MVSGGAFEMDFIGLALVFLVAFVGAIVSHKMRQSMIVGYIIVGVLLGIAAVELPEQVGGHVFTSVEDRDLRPSLELLSDLGLTFLKPGGTLAIYGLHDFGQCTITPLRSKGTFTFYNGGYDEAETHEEVMMLLDAGRLDAAVWLDLDNPYPLERITDALDALRDRRVVKALVRIRG